MSCPRLQVVLQTDLDRPLDAELASHAELCADCGPAIERRHAAYGLLRAEVPALSSSERAQLWWKIEDARRFRAPFWSSNWIYALGAAAAAVLVFFLFFPRKQPVSSTSWALTAGEARLMAGEQPLATGAELPPNVWVIVPERAALSLQEARIESLDRAYVALEGPELRLARGILEVRLAEASPSLVIGTPAAKLEAIGASLRVEAARDHTTIEVKRGVVEARDEKSGVKRTLRAGDRASFGVVVAVAPPTPAPAAAPPPPPVLPQKRAAEKPKAAPPAPAAPPIERVERDRRDLDSARALLKTDHQKAGAIAETVLRRSPSAPEEVHALSIAADAYRRSGRLLEAASTYQRVAEHEAGGGYAEEALLRRAMIFDQLQRSSDALKELDLAARRFSKGYLLPERLALTAELLMKIGDFEAAARVLESSDDPALERTKRLFEDRSRDREQNSRP